MDDISASQWHVLNNNDDKSLMTTMTCPSWRRWHVLNDDGDMSLMWWQVRNHHDDTSTDWLVIVALSVQREWLAEEEKTQKLVLNRGMGVVVSGPHVQVSSAMKEWGLPPNSAAKKWWRSPNSSAMKRWRYPPNSSWLLPTDPVDFVATTELAMSADHGASINMF